MINENITIVVNTFNSEDKIFNCLDSINSFCKVIIIENSNNINFKKKIEEKYPFIDCHLTGENLGYAKGNNLGLSKVKSKYALILNPDTTLESETLNNFLKTAPSSYYLNVSGQNAIRFAFQLDTAHSKDAINVIEQYISDLKRTY